MARDAGAKHIATSRRRYKRADGTVQVYETHLLRRSYRDDAGRPQKETLANLSALPGQSIETLKKSLAGKALVEVGESFTVQRSLPHGDVAAVHAMAQNLGIRKLLGPACRERDLAYALIISRIVRPRSKLSTIGWWEDSTLGHDLQISGASTDEVYAAMDWLVGRQERIETELARRHLRSGGIAMFDLSSSWLEGRSCDLAAFGYSRDGKRSRKQIEYGLLTDDAGRPVAITVFPGNTSDTRSFKDAVAAVKDTFGIDEIVMVGDRGMITNARITELRAIDGMDWITALRAPQIAALAAADGPLQMSLFDEQNFAEITHPDYPDERLICCRNPILAEERARKRTELLVATEAKLDKIVERVANGRLAKADKIGIAVGKVVNKHKVGKHFTFEITDHSCTYHRNENNIAAETSLDGIYVIRTSLGQNVLDSTDTITAYKNLSFVERDFRTIKVDDLDLRPVFHYLATRVRAHVFLCMLAAHITWHLRKAVAELTFTDEHIPQRQDPVAPASRSTSANTKDAAKQTPQGLHVRSFRDLLDHLKTLNREIIDFAGQRIEKLTDPTPTQRRVFELINTPIPLDLRT